MEEKVKLDSVVKENDIKVNAERYYTIVTSTIGNLAAMYFIDSSEKDEEKPQK